MKFNVQGDLLAMVTHGPPPDSARPWRSTNSMPLRELWRQALSPRYTTSYYVSYDIIGTDTIYDSIPQWFRYRHFMGLEFDTSDITYISANGTPCQPSIPWIQRTVGSHYR